MRDDASCKALPCYRTHGRAGKSKAIAILRTISDDANS
jgi:hypothetical protein